MPRLGRYEILQRLARGSVADVLLARASGHAHVSLAYQLRPHLALEAAMSVDVTETTHVESSSEVMRN